MRWGESTVHLKHCRIISLQAAVAQGSSQGVKQAEMSTTG